MAEVLSLTQFRKKNPLKKGSDELKYVTELFKPLKPEKVNISKPTAFRAGDVVSASGIYKIKLGIDLYKLARAKVSGSSARPKKGQQKPKTIFIHTSDEIEFKEVKPDKELEIYFFNGNGKGREVRLIQTDAPWKDSKGKKAPISTNQQELISMKIIEEVASGDTTDYNNFAEMYKDKKSGLKKIHSNLPATEDWWDHFVLQFNDAKKTLKVQGISSAKYTTFSQDAKAEGFMKFISDLVTTGADASTAFKASPLGNKKYSKKDSWNPADIWLIRKNISGKRFDDPDSVGKKVMGFKQAIMAAPNIVAVNKILVKAFNEKIIVGISLKKSDQKTLKFELVNLKAKVSDDVISPIVFTGVKFICIANKDKNGQATGFKSLTSNLFLTQGKRKYRLDFRSNRGGTEDITYDYMEDSADAGLGKVPKDRLKEYVAKFSNKHSDFPHKTDYDKFGMNKDWQDKVDKINDSGILEVNTDARAGMKAKYGYPADWKNFVTNMKSSWLKKAGGKSTYTNKGKHNISMMQMFDFIYILAVIYGTNGINAKGKRGLGPKGFITFITDLFYFAQKKGMKWHFGPFGKLY